MSNIKSRFLKSLVIFQQLFTKRMSSSPSPTAELKTLEDFGYKFNSDGESQINYQLQLRIVVYFILGVLKKLDSEGKVTEKGFEFQVYAEHKANQARYEAIGKIIDEEVYRILETKGGLERVKVRLEDNIPGGHLYVLGWRSLS